MGIGRVGPGMAIDLLPVMPGILGEIDAAGRRLTAALAPPTHPPIRFGCTCQVCEWVHWGRLTAGRTAGPTTSR